MLRMSTLFLRTLREDPADAEVPSHKLLVRGGFVRRISPGIFSWLPLGYQVYRNVERIIREEIEKSINEASMKPKDFYKTKSDMLEEVLNLIDSALTTLDNIQALEESQAMEEDTDIRSAMMDLQPVRGFIEGIHSATAAMTTGE